MNVNSMNHSGISEMCLSTEQCLSLGCFFFLWGLVFDFLFVLFCVFVCLGLVFGIFGGFGFFIAFVCLGFCRGFFWLVGFGFSVISSCSAQQVINMVRVSVVED